MVASSNLEAVARALAERTIRSYFRGHGDWIDDTSELAVSRYVDAYWPDYADYLAPDAIGGDTLMRSRA